MGTFDNETKTSTVVPNTFCKATSLAGSLANAKANETDGKKLDIAQARANGRKSIFSLPSWLSKATPTGKDCEDEGLAAEKCVPKVPKGTNESAANESAANESAAN